MRFRVITPSVLLILAAISIKGQTAPSSAAAPPTTPAHTSLPTPTLPSGQPQQQGLRPNQLPASVQNTPSQVPGTTVTDIAVTPADQALLAQVHQTVVTRVQGMGAWAPVHFQAQNGVVTILGVVPDATLQQQVAAAVQQTPGVLNVINQLTTSGSEQAIVNNTQDQALLIRVRQAVVPQIQVAGTPIPVNFVARQGVVTITGTVPAVEQKRQIFTLVQQVPGVVQVNDLVRVNPAGAANRGLGMINSGTTVVTNGVVNNSAIPGTQPMVDGNNSGPQNLTPTGPTNSTALPLAPQGRTDLPPGLQRRTDLTPTTNGSPQSSP